MILKMIMVIMIMMIIIVKIIIALPDIAFSTLSRSFASTKS